MINLRLEAPWYTYQKKLFALFERDPDILVGDLIQNDDSDSDYVINIEVMNHEKFEALDRVLPTYKYYGNVSVRILLYDEENNDVMPGIDLYETIFKDNPILEDIRTLKDASGFDHGYVRFKPEVVQFFDDNISDYNGNWSGLAADIAKEVFENDSTGMHFCTASKEKTNKPLGEWP